MAHDSYHFMMSLALDGELSGEEQKRLDEHLHTCTVCADLWGRMHLLGTMFESADEAVPSPDFTAMVMTRVDLHESRRRWYPLLIALLTGSSLAAAVSVAVPVMLLTLGVDGILARWPFVGRALSYAVQALAFVLDGTTFLATALADWLRFLLAEPAALAVVLAALTLASTWIGILESFKVTAPARQRAA
jgi:predicted anti-sigma-YlaC factor YlaD